MNRLGTATSPYLQQHADNPVDWWPWSAEAFAEAERRDVPVLISVGYAACHWCHVMAHESFEDPAVAEIMNADFVAIKVDREERPDVDAVYMTATQAMTGQGGWPMTVFATPDGQPFLCGTYYPRASFLRILDAITSAWTDQREAVLNQGSAVVDAIKRSGSRQIAGAALTPEALDAAAKSLDADFDDQYGGFGGAPKFPPHLALLFLLRHAGRTGDGRSLEMVRATCEQMARGGIYDQLAGGFARYAVDGTWTVPHFEKMLYDNAMLLRVYTELYRVTGDDLALRVATETVEFLLDGLRTPEGGFASALDADTNGVEGATYAWTPGQLVDALGETDGRWVADLLGVTAAGTFEHGTSVLRLARDLDGAHDVAERWAPLRAHLRRQRDGRPQPARDDKVIAEWNGLAITALARFAEVTGSTTAGDAAVTAGRLIRDLHVVDGRLRRVSRDGSIGEQAGVLADYGSVATAFAQLHQLTGDPEWLTAAGDLLDVALAQFGDGGGGFYDTAADAETLITRPADPTDGATPSGSSAVIEALTTHTALTGEVRFREAADAAIATVVPVIAGHARFAGLAAAVGEAMLAGPLEIAIVGDDRGDLVRAAIHGAPAGSVIVRGRPDQPGVPLLAQRPVLDGQPTAYVCRGFVCQRPVTTPADLTAQLTPPGRTSS
ncbi:MAG TPA: thioredoxin domain-containing protein [Micromonosporaceae bacterium]